MEQLPQYKCHKVVRAAKITGVMDHVEPPRLLLEVDGRTIQHPVPDAFLDRHKPQAGSYLVQYEPDGYASVSPGPQFEEGYTRVRPVPEDRMLQFFAFEHLPAHLQVVSRPFGELARQLVTDLPSNAERTVALRKLLEAKDCAVRALLFKEPSGAPAPRPDPFAVPRAG